MAEVKSAPIFLPGVHAYAEKSVTAGEAIHFRVSSDRPYHLSIGRLGMSVDGPLPSEDLTWTCIRVAQSRQQPLHPGSYVYVSKRLSADCFFNALTLECWVRPWQFKGYQGLITQCDDFQDEDFQALGFGLFINPYGEPVFYLGDGDKLNNTPLRVSIPISLRQWHHLVGVWDGSIQSLWVNGQLLAERAFKEPIKLDNGALRLGASSREGFAANFLNGDIAMPTIYSRALSKQEIQHQFSQKALNEKTLDGLLGCWPLNEELGKEIADISQYKRNGHIINHATWMIGGPSFDSATVSRYGNYDPAQDSSRGHGLRFASDDLYDCGWAVTDVCNIPDDAKPGVYVGRIRFGNNYESCYDVTFIVKKGANRPRAQILVLCSSNTWLAYNAPAFPINPEQREGWGEGIRELSIPSAPAYNCYLAHEDGQPAYQIGINMPWPLAQPYILYSSPDVGFSHLLRGERFVHLWLEQNDYDYDIITDFDLHRNPSILMEYTVLVINGHSEYWSIPAYEGVDNFLRLGGRVVVLSGNTMFWRVSFNEDCTIMECRKFPETVAIPPVATIGELYHSHDGKRGGLLRECGYPAWKVLGLECVGYWSADAQNFEVYYVEQPDHFLFNQPNSIAVYKGESFGHAPDGGLPKAVGHEFDVRVNSLPTTTNLSSVNLPLTNIEGITLLATSQKTAKVFDYSAQWITVNDAVVSEIIYWERPQGGLVFYVGSTGAGWALSADEKFQLMMRNVLHHFGVKSNTQLNKASS